MRLHVLQQRRAGPHVAHLLGRATHVDVDDLRAMIDVEARGPGQHGRIVAGNLHRDRIRFAGVIHALARLVGMPQARVGSGHFRHRQTGAHALAQLAEGLVGDAGHGRQGQWRIEAMGTDLHRATCLVSSA